ncbi:ABC transporter substrate-binding protein [Clostridium sp. BNL1100]|uniref:ABC transporter substrate-binding protein n=1 Tax=Clostridium sp. BNL1100 TaxID=755731 RepID=UPI00024A7913|nr:ABC transporter substrate-binding protein [Clostridium sp. BNL1100]AEY65663.1 ABC-type nitrate/sulfonate/bicarbonate transport system, periplasmic component [Clostridium sp. BNL1100]
MNLKKFIAAALVFGLILGTAACGKSADVKESSSSDAKTVKIAYLPLTHALPVFVENELQDKSGQKYKIELVKYGSWPELMDALNTGHVDGASVLIELAMKAKEQGIGVKAVALGHKDGNVVVVSNKINNVSDLKGKKFAIPHRQSSHNILLGQMLKNAGLSYKDVNIVELPPPEMPAALAQGQIAGYSVAEPFGAKSVALSTGKVLFESNELWKDSICCSLVLSDKFISSNKDAAKEVVSGYREAGEYVGSHKDEANAIAKKYLNLDDKVLDLSMKWISYNDLEITREAYDSLTSKIKEFGISSNPPAYDDFVDSSLSGK